jgi:hypothetical protein
VNCAKCRARRENAARSHSTDRRSGARSEHARRHQSGYYVDTVARVDDAWRHVERNIAPWTGTVTRAGDRAYSACSASASAAARSTTSRWCASSACPGNSRSRAANGSCTSVRCPLSSSSTARPQNGTTAAE